MALKIYGPADDLPHFLAIICNDNFLECMWHPIMHDFSFGYSHTSFLFFFFCFKWWTNFVNLSNDSNPFNSLAISLCICATLFTIQFLSFTDFYSTVIIFEIKKNTDCSTRTTLFAAFRIISERANHWRETKQLRHTLSDRW